MNRDLGVTVLVSLHQVDFAFAYCPRTVALRAGEVVYDGPTAALTPQRLRDLYGTQLDELLPAPGAAVPLPDTTDTLPGFHLNHPGLKAA